MKQTRELEELPVGKLLIKFAIPAMTGTMVTSLYNVVDRIFLGRYVGESGIAATTVSMPLMLIVMAVGMLIGFGTNSQISIKLGEKKHLEAEQLLGQGFFLFTISSILFTAISLIFMKPLLHLFGASESILPFAQTYLSVVVIGTLPHQISFGANSFIRGEGNPRIAMATMIIGGLLNIVFDYLFIAVFGWGIAGAAWATVIGYSISAIWVVHYYLSGKSLVKLRRKNFCLNLESTWGVMVMGSPHFIINSISSIQMSLFNNQLTKYGGDNAISVMGVIMSFNLIWLMPVIGISQGLQPIVGYNYGAKKFARVRKALLMAIFAATVLCTFFFLLIELFPQHIFMLFIGKSDSEFVITGVAAIRRFLILLPLVGFLIITGNYFQFTGRPKHSLIMTAARQIFFLIPAIIFLPGIWGLNGVWFAMPTSDAGGLIITGVFFFLELKDLKTREIAYNISPTAT